MTHGPRRSVREDGDDAAAIIADDGVGNNYSLTKSRKRAKVTLVHANDSGYCSKRNDENTNDASNSSDYDNGGNEDVRQYSVSDDDVNGSGEDADVTAAATALFEMKTTTQQRLRMIDSYSSSHLISLPSLSRRYFFLPPTSVAAATAIMAAASSIGREWERCQQEEQQSPSARFATTDRKLDARSPSPDVTRASCARPLSDAVTPGRASRSTKLCSPRNVAASKDAQQCAANRLTHQGKGKNRGEKRHNADDDIGTRAETAEKLGETTHATASKRAKRQRRESSGGVNSISSGENCADDERSDETSSDRASLPTTAIAIDNGRRRGPGGRATRTGDQTTDEHHLAISSKSRAILKKTKRKKKTAIIKRLVDSDDDELVIPREKKQHRRHHHRHRSSGCSSHRPNTTISNNIVSSSGCDDYDYVTTTSTDSDVKELRAVFERSCSTSKRSSRRKHPRRNNRRRDDDASLIITANIEQPQRANNNIIVADAAVVDIRENNEDEYYYNENRLEPIDRAVVSIFNNHELAREYFNACDDNAADSGIEMLD